LILDFQPLFAQDKPLKFNSLAELFKYLAEKNKKLGEIFYFLAERIQDQRPGLQDSRLKIKFQPYGLNLSWLISTKHQESFKQARVVLPGIDL